MTVFFLSQCKLTMQSAGRRKYWKGESSQKTDASKMKLESQISLVLFEIVSQYLSMATKHLSETKETSLHVGLKQLCLS